MLLVSVMFLVLFVIGGVLFWLWIVGYVNDVYV